MSALVLSLLHPDADRSLLARLADYPDHVAQFARDGGEAAHLRNLAKFAEEVALPGHDGDKAAQLLDNAKVKTTRVLAELTRTAMERILGQGRNILRAKRLFDDDELAKLADQLAASNATADLLGRSRIRLRAAHAEKLSEDAPTDFKVFDDAPGLHPMAPHAALEHFKQLVPSLNLDVRHFGPLMERRAFTMAEATSEVVLDKVKGAILDFLRTGEKLRQVPKKIDTILDAAGITPKQSGYASMVARTNLMEAYNAGSQAEFSDPDVGAVFPVWKPYVILDGRERPAHRAYAGKYFDRSVLFAEVRGTDPGSVCNCRCSWAGVWRGKWKKLQEAGARVTSLEEYLESIKGMKS